ncbi:peptide chain release factor N(5)-glutamine methyltransferase [Lewinella sp. JB7]|uniref:peptide chain release factor N(5)-glutamine methyltransferase n=1 Tax=Lewinella sp. JB7 TaxID=2962887 RepID=UPI0020C96616|nr:peptide chain release factor N(5)-glutamine methyltransferase [Lewinella sp. JB7]MCP9235860.1 peptide chain release factor N(5)-glutamine methyltransferase [Lewinella sp. JB7]
MNTDDLARHFRTELTPLLGEREARSTTRLLMEDLFACRQGGAPRELTQEEPQLAQEALSKLRAGTPVQYVTGIADFYGLQLHVSPAVLIPRPETEELVEWILADHPSTTDRTVVDIGTGSGCIPLALKRKRPQWTCYGVDVSPAAIDVARENGDRLGGDVTFVVDDVLESSFSLPGPRVDILVSNPPYIPPSETARMGESTVSHEPHIALFVPEEDPLLFYRRIAELGKVSLQSGGRLYMETNEHNSEAVARLLESNGYGSIERRRDLQGKWRMIGAILG